MSIVSNLATYAPAFRGVLTPTEAAQKLEKLRRENARLETAPRRTFFGPKEEMANLQGWQREIVDEMQDFIDGLNMVCQQGDHTPSEVEIELNSQGKMFWAFRVAETKWIPALRREGFALTSVEYPEKELEGGALEFEKLRWTKMIRESEDWQWREFFIEIRRKN